jgi:hypothetical protein
LGGKYFYYFVLNFEGLFFILFSFVFYMNDDNTHGDYTSRQWGPCPGDGGHAAAGEFRKESDYNPSGSGGDDGCLGCLALGLGAIGATLYVLDRFF